MKMEIKISKENLSKTNGGVFEGWGTSLCWWAHRVGYSEKLAKLCAELFFSKDGLALNIMRYNIGGGDDPTHNHIERSDSKIPGWLELDKNGKSVWNYNADENQLRVLKYAYQAAGEDAYVEVFSNSPPYFMTVSGCSSGSKNATDTNLKDECVCDFANYLALVSQYIQNELHIKIKSVSPMNEPDTNYWKMNSPKQEGCHIDPGQKQSRLLVETRKAFDEKGLKDIILAACDETSTKTQIRSYKLLSEEAKKAVSRISTHSYITQSIKSLGKLQKKEQFNLWMSEVDGSGTDGKNAKDMASALWLAKKIISDINDLGASAWVLWLVLDMHKSKNGYDGNADMCSLNEEKGFWGLGYCDHDEEKIVLTQKYYAFGQFTRFIRPKMNIVHVNKTTLAAYDKNEKKLVIVAVNDKSRKKSVTYDISDFEICSNACEVFVTSGNTDGGKKWNKEESVTFKDTLKITLEPNSVTTLCIS